MSSTREERPHWQRPHRRLRVAIVGLALGAFFLASGLSRPSIANMRTVDLLHLLATGMCLGTGLVGLVIYFIDRRKG